MFKVGDTVRNVAADIVGTVVEIDGNTVYLEQPNGCEVDFVASALVLESEYQAKHDRSVRGDAASHENDKTYDAVIANLYPAVIELGRQFHARAKRIPGIAPKSWDDLSSLQKLNAVSEATEIPVQSWIEANRPAAKTPIGALQLSILAAARQKGRS